MTTPPFTQTPSLGTAPTPAAPTSLSVQDFAQQKTQELGRRIKRSQNTFYITSAVAIIASGLFIATASVGINVYNSCRDFGESSERVSGLSAFFIIMLIISIIVFLGAIAGLVVYLYYFGGNEEVKTV